MLISAKFCQELLEKELSSLSKIPFTLHVETRPNAQELSLNPINIYSTWEPEEYFGSHSWVAANAEKFDYILTWDINHLQYLPNAVFCPFGTSAFHDKLEYPLDEGDTHSKEEKITFIRGAKHSPVHGHHLRHELYNRRHEITNIRTEFYDRTSPEYAATPEEDTQWFSQRKSIFSSPLFHICIENTAHDNYFTEKIIDCFLFRTVPIYYGAPNIGSYFDDRGIINFQSVDELIGICNNLTRQDYVDRIIEVYKNQVACTKYLNLGRTIRETIEGLLQNSYPDYLKMI